MAELTDVRTGWPNCSANTWCVAQDWAVTNHSDGIAESPVDIYIDDARIEALRWLPPGRAKKAHGIAGFVQSRHGVSCRVAVPAMPAYARNVT